MEDSYLAVLSRYNHQEGYLDLALEDLVRSGKAIMGLDFSSKALISILHDKNKNPYLLFNAKDLEKVKLELKRKIVRAEGAIRFSNIRSLCEYFEKENIHKEIQEKYSEGLIYSTNSN
jgi:hypothetical protein